MRESASATSDSTRARRPRGARQRYRQDASESVRIGACPRGRHRAGRERARGASYPRAGQKGTWAVNDARPLESNGDPLRKRARVAQLAEQGPLKPKVQGSIPCASTTRMRKPCSRKQRVLRTKRLANAAPI